MRSPRYAKVSLAVLLSIAALVVYVHSPLSQWLSVKSLERQVKRNIDPKELQQWATNLLAQHSDGLHRYDDYSGTTLPVGLKKVKGFGQAVEIFPHGPRMEPDVWIFCGGPKGSPFLVVGSPSLATPKSPNIISWKPGIYFVYSSGWR